MAGIKTRDAVKGTIKQLDRVVVATERFKDVSAKTKERVQSTYNTEESSPVEYAENQIQEKVKIGTIEGTHQVSKVGRKGAEVTRNSIVKGKEYVRAKQESRMQNEAVDKARKNVIKRASRQVGNKSIKTAEEIQKTIKTTGKREVKEATKSVKHVTKTASRASKTVIKTSEQTAKTVKVAKKTTQKTAEMTSKAAKGVAKGIKDAVKGSVQAVKAIIAGTKAMLNAIIAGGWISVVIILVCCLFGAAIYFFGDTSSSGYTPVSAEVEAYEPMIRQYAKQYGIEEYVELIKAVMMQESGGKGTDPMQASESGFNTKYSHSPNAITNPEYSIECGVQAIKSVLTEAKVENPVDMEHIKLALQGYNYGNGYIQWAVAKDGRYTVANARQFSVEQAHKHGWNSYGDPEYITHVLRYYPYGHYSMGMGKGSEAMVSSALAQVGNAGGNKFWSWYGFNSRVEWCACFVSWNADQSGYMESVVIPKFSYCPSGVEWFKNNNQWQARGYVPSPGDIIFFDWRGDGISDHVGIVEKVADGKVYTIEGNSGDAVRENVYPIGYTCIYGYGVPKY